MAFRSRQGTRLFGLTGLLFFGLVLSGRTQPPGAPPASSADVAVSKPAPAHLIRKGDRIAVIGSSSTRIGVWPRALEFLLRTRHPELNLQFKRFTTGGGTFQTGLDHLDAWLDDFKPTLVIFNYGGNDASQGRAGLPRFKENMERAVVKVQAHGARVILLTPQAADVRKAGLKPAADRTLYAETMLDFGRRKGWTVIDVHHPIEALQKARQELDPNYTILRDNIHLTHSAYVAWAFLLYDRLDLPFVTSAVSLRADGSVVATDHCGVREVESRPDGLSFTRLDLVLPIFPPGPLPPRNGAPMEAHSSYMLQVTGLAEGPYEIRVAGQPIGTVTDEELAAGVNLNTLLLDSKYESPWAPISQSIWQRADLDRVGRTRLRFEVRKR